MSKARDLANAGTALTTVSATELGYLDGVTSAVQTQIDSKIGQSTAINPTIVDAKGDIIAASAADTVARLAVGSNDQVLTADSSTATGLKWATPSGALTLSSIASGNFNSGTSLTISSLTQDFIQIHLYGLTWATAASQIRVRPNNSTSAVYDSISAFASGGPDSNYVRTQNGTSFDLGGGRNQTFNNNANYYIITLSNCKQTGFTTIVAQSCFSEGVTVNTWVTGIFKTAAQITSVNIATTGGYTFNGTGTYAIYGG